MEIFCHRQKRDTLVIIANWRIKFPKYFCRSALIQQGLQKNSRQIARR